MFPLLLFGSYLKNQTAQKAGTGNWKLYQEEKILRHQNKIMPG